GVGAFGLKQVAAISTLWMLIRHEFLEPPLPHGARLQRSGVRLMLFLVLFQLFGRRVDLGGLRLSLWANKPAIAAALPGFPAEYLIRGCGGCRGPCEARVRLRHLQLWQ